MNVGIVGLGLIGGSFAKTYSKAGHTVWAYDRDASVTQYAIMSGAAEEELLPEMLPKCDLILLCIFPRATVEYLEKNGEKIGKRPVVVDCCGTKREVVAKCMESAAKYGFTYVGGHPMAGTQYSGFANSVEGLFENAPMLIVPPDKADIFLLERIKKLLMPAGFSQITVTDAKKHDEMIAYTSQLAHIVSSSYIKSPCAKEHKGMSAGSYKDMTRVACLNSEMWTELCLDNRDNLVKEIDILMRNLEEYRTALENSDAEGLKRLFEEGRKIKTEVDG